MYAKVGRSFLRAWPLALALALVTGMALASIPDLGGVIRGCYSKVGGFLRVIDTAKGQKCSTKFEVPIDWNQQGPVGPQGPAGQDAILAVSAGNGGIVNAATTSIPDRDWSDVEGLTGMSLTVDVPSTSLLLIRFSAETACGPQVASFLVMCSVRMLIDGACPDSCARASVFDSGSMPIGSNNFFSAHGNSFEQLVTVGPGTHTVRVQLKIDSYNAPPATDENANELFHLENSMLIVERLSAP